MKKYILILIFALPIALAAQMTYVPDDNFEQALIDKGYDTPPLNDSVPTKNIDTVTYLNVFQRHIKDLKGIEDFGALTVLDCSANGLTSLDVSKNTALTWLGCHKNGITSLNLTNNTALERLDCYYNDLTSLDVSKNTALEVLICTYNGITSLDVSKNTALTILNCHNNGLTSLDVSKNTALTWLGCNENAITSLDVSKNTALKVLYCSDNAITSLDVSKNTALIELICQLNPLKSLDVSNNTALILLYCHNNPIKTLNVSNNTALKELWCYENALTSLDVSKNTALTELYCHINPDLYCIQVADSAEAANKWNWGKDEHAVWSEDCKYTGVEDNKFENNDVSVSPNPAADFIEIVGVDGVNAIMIYDVLGIEHPATAWHPSTEGNVRIDISGLAAGVYFVSVGGQMYKFIKM